jgi:hypothetical protein
MDIKRKIIMYYLCCFLAGSRLFASVPEEPQAERDNPISASRKEAQERAQRNREQREWKKKFKQEQRERRKRFEQLQRDIEKNNRRARVMNRATDKLLAASPNRAIRKWVRHEQEQGVKKREHERDQREREERLAEWQRQREER